LPFNGLLHPAQLVHRKDFNPKQVQWANLLSIKTGVCPEDCACCSQSVQHVTGLRATKLMDVAEVGAAGEQAKASGATCLCVGVNAGMR
jgi:biotin synthase